MRKQYVVINGNEFRAALDKVRPDEEIVIAGNITGNFTIPTTEGYIPVRTLSFWERLKRKAFRLFR